MKWVCVPMQLRVRIPTFHPRPLMKKGGCVDIEVKALVRWRGALFVVLAYQRQYCTEHGDLLLSALFRLVSRPLLSQEASLQSHDAGVPYKFMFQILFAASSEERVC